MSRAARGCSAPLRKSCFAMSGVQQGKKIRSFKYITCPQFQKMPGALDILKIISEKLKKQVKDIGFEVRYSIYCPLKR